MKEQIGKLFKNVKFSYFSKLNFIVKIFVANFFSPELGPELEPEPAARPGAGAGQNWTGSTTLSAADTCPEN